MFGLTCISVLFSLVSSQNVKSLCEDPIIHAADRLPNNTYRVYRGDHYWELLGLPDERGRLIGPYPVWYQYMAPVDRYSSVQTVIGGNADGLTWKFNREKYWLYRQSGVLMEGGKPGFDWDLFPRGGFNAVLNDGKMWNKRFPIMIGFSGIRVYYYNTDNRRFRRIGSADGYQGGMNGEDLPGDLTAAFAFPSTDDEVKYYVYLFRRYQYCKRPIVGEKQCEVWRNNTELFGCSAPISASTISASAISPDQPQSEKPSDGNSQPIPEPEDQKQEEKDAGSKGGKEEEASNTESNSESQSSGGSGTFLIVIIVVVLVVVAVVIAIVAFAMRGTPEPKQGVDKSRAKAPLPKSKAGVSAKSAKPSKA